MTDLPDPLTPRECDLTDFQYMELDVRRLRDSKFASTPNGDAFRAGVLLWCAAWHQVPAASLPDDDVELANLAGYGRMPFSVKEWKKVRAEAMYGFVKCSDGRLYHPIIAEKALAAYRAKLKHAYDKFCDRLRKENSRRAKEQQPAVGIPTFEQWNSGQHENGIPPEISKPSAGIPPEAPTVSGGIPTENSLKGNREGTEREQNGEGDSLKPSGALSPPPASLASPAAPSAPPAARGTSLPKDWQLPKPWGEWALAEQSTWTREHVLKIAATFKDHWIAKPGKDGRKSDWEATWRNWVRREKPLIGPNASVSRQQGVSMEERQRQSTEAARELLFGNEGEAIDAAA